MATRAINLGGNARRDVSRTAKPSHDADSFLVREALSGWHEAFGMLFERYQGKMFHVANRILRNHEDAEDAVQRAFQHAFAHLKAFAGVSRFSTWLSRITINEALQLLRKRRPGRISLEAHTTEEGETRVLDIADFNATPEEQSSRNELQGIVREAIGELRPIFRMVVQMYEMDERSSGKTAQALGLTNATAKTRALRARRILRGQIEARLGLRKGAGTFLFSTARNNFGGLRRSQALAG